MASRSEHGEPTRCDCECHRDPRIKHVMACCDACEKCGVRFSSGLAKHRESCAGTKA